MKRKNNPWVALVWLLLLTLLLATIVGCAVTADAATTKTEKRFTGEYAGRAAGLDLVVITDNETGVQYLVTEKYGHGYGIGVTVLQDGED